MPTRRIILAATLLLALPLAAQAQGKAVSIGKIISGNGLHIPTYIAMDRGYYKEEGLDAKFISLTGSGLIKGALSGAIDFIPIPSGGAQAALSGAEIRYVVGQSLASQWLIVTRPDINKPEDLKGKIIGYGRIGAADYDEGADVMRSAFKMEVGRDYKVISFQGEPERIAALVNGDIQGALISIPHAPKAVNAGMKILIRTAEHVQRAGGTIWGRKAFIDQNPDVVAKLIRAQAKATMFYRTDKAGSLPSLREHLGIDNDKDAGLVWDQTHNLFAAELPKELFHEIFEQRRQIMIAAKQWAPDKPLPDPEQFLMRDVLEKTLKDMNYVPAKLAKPTN
jgi:ABC-type nitrate/sulfonate/bicarbonate transport system substrate-binding protein